MQGKVSIITATTGNPLLARNIESVKNQTYPNIQHLIVCDGPDAGFGVTGQVVKTGGIVLREGLDFIYLPYATGKDRYNGHRIYGAATFLAKGDYFIFLDDDNYLEPSHVQDCMDVINQGSSWTFSFRNIVDKEGNFLCQDNCESLGMWPSVLGPTDYFLDVNTYFLPRDIAVAIVPVWYCKFREPGQPEIDRKIMSILRQHFGNYDSTYKYSVNYTVGNTALSVTPEFFKTGNQVMYNKYEGKLPWLKK